MNFLGKTIMVLVLCLIAQLFFPWWSITIASFIAGLIFILKSNLIAFLAGFIGAGSLWFSYSLWIDISSASILSERVVQFFPVPADPMSLVIAAGLIAGLTGGFACSAANSLRKAMSQS